ncbi:MAG: hypothetical protein ABIH46_02785 [Chloroflexota bacterium]
MDKSRLGGILICIITVVAAVLFIWGIVVRNYWALAIPVIIGFLGVLSLGFWIGWTMVVTEVEPAMPLPKQGETPSGPTETID